ncbi:MAG: M64 family metallo-endopeptidase [Chloroflexota bacterium]|nr:M64 family metallo-endopeptidase [Chloroflexota bacterium]MDQ5864938.1 M64 family metallo-endopeptidase [Chloroflexota bacterium]
MGASDGYIVSGSMTKVIDHGPASSRWNVVVLGDGYRASELEQYHTDVQSFIDSFYNTSPFDERWCGINIYRVDVVSTDSGADDPSSCTDGTVGSGATPNTFYDSTFCSDGATRRLLGVDSGRARADSVALVPQVHVTVVIVNDPQYGGAGYWGNRVGTCSIHPNSAEIAIHEIGHAAFGLADEYGGAGSAPGAEPIQPNVTISTSLATLKWSAQVPPGTPIPTRCNAACASSGCTPPDPPVAGTPVGTYEGGQYTECDVYRPQPSCKMRALGIPFCEVCKRVIRDTLAPFMPPESLTLTTPSLQFTNIPEGIGGTGVTTYRAVTFEIASCTPKTFRITAGPTGGFGTPFGTIFPVPVSKITSLTYGRVWLSYTSTNAGDVASGSVTVECDETGEVWVIPISANTVARPKSAAVMVLDRSGSMDEDAGDNRKKVQLLREAAKVFVEVMLEGDAVGLVTFDDLVDRLMDVTDVGPAGSGAGRTTANNLIDGPGLDPRGATSVGGGIAEGKSALDDAQAVATPPYDVTALVVLTDGNENTPPCIDDVSVTANTFAIGFGLPSNVSADALYKITQNTNGYLLVTGQITTDIRTRLQKYFLQILAGITNANVVLDPPGMLTTEGEHRIPFTVTEADMGLDVILLSPIPPIISFELETPDGTRIDPGAVAGLGTTEYVVRQNVSFYRLSLPAVTSGPSGSHDGIWNAILRIGRSEVVPTRPSTLLKGATSQQDPALLALLQKGLLPYNLIVHTYSNLVFKAVAQQNSSLPGSEVKLFASLREYDVPVEGRASVWAEVTLPDNSTRLLGLSETEPGEFQGRFATTLSGLYTIRVRARGETFFGTAFTREQVVSAHVFLPGGGGEDVRGTPDGRNVLCELLECLTVEGVISPKLYEELLSRGIDLRRLIECLQKYCREQSREQNTAANRERRRTVAGQQLRDVGIAHQLKGLERKDLIHLLTELLRYDE